MPQTGSYDALVVDAGPNGLSAGIAIAQTRCTVLVVEGRDTVGGGARSAALTVPGFLHDVCSAVHPADSGLALLHRVATARPRLRLGAAPRAAGASSGARFPQGQLVGRYSTSWYLGGRLPGL